MSIQITLQAVNAAFAKLQQQATNLRPILPAIAELIESDIKDNFDAGGRWSGSGPTTLLSGGTEKWKPLAPSRFAEGGWALGVTKKATRQKD